MFVMRCCRCNSKVKSVKQHPANAGPEGALHCIAAPKAHGPLLSPAKVPPWSLHPMVAPAAQHVGGCGWPPWLAAYSVSCMLCRNRLYIGKFSLHLWLIFVLVYKTRPTSIGYPLSPGQALWIGLYSTQLYYLLTAVRCFPGASLCKLTAAWM